ncbi:MAG: hypothetical protein NTY15_18020 [Planctomycetota bacterium]|nr:hypothetical protein [Planctomycetota bacterium]
MPRNLRQRWYSVQGQSRTKANALQRSNGVRKVASLLVLLMMVLILIQQTSDVKKVEKVAIAIGLLPSENQSLTAVGLNAYDEAAINSLRQANRQSVSEVGVANSEIEPSVLEIVSLETTDDKVETYYRIWKALLRKVPVTVVGAMARKLFQVVAPESSQASSVDETKVLTIPWGGVHDWHREFQTQVANWTEIETENASTKLSRTTHKSDVSPTVPSFDFAQELEKHAAWFQQFEPADPPRSALVQEKFFRGLQMALDEKLLEQVVDNSNWGGVDRLPFVRTWQRVGILRELLASKMAVSNHFPKIEVSQLLSNGSAIRARPLRFEGSIARVDSIASISEAGFGTTEYQVIWLRPYETSNQPVCVYAPLENIDRNVKIEKGTEVIVTGVFFKRMAHSSERGGDVSPLLLAAYVKPFGSNETLPTNPFLVGRNGKSERISWQPPADTRTPFLNVQSRLEQSVLGLDDAVLESGFNGLDASGVAKPIFELQKLVPEINLLLERNPDWPIADVATLNRLSGIVTKVSRIPISAQLASLLEQPHVYRCEFESGSQPIVFLSAAVPGAWKQANGNPQQEIRQPCQVDVLRLVDGSSYAWTRAIQWKKGNGIATGESRDWRPSISKPFAYLFDHDWDLAWLEQVRELQSDPIRPLSSKEIEPFYRLMRIAKGSSLEVAPPRNEGSEPLSIVSILDSLTKSRKSVKPSMERVAMNMRIVRVSRVSVDDPAMAAILGSDRYYQLDTMADIGNREYEDAGDQGGDKAKEPVVYHKEYPVTCVAIDIPDWLLNAEGSASVLDSKLEHVWYPRLKTSGAGWFYRFWSYKTQETLQSLGVDHRQRGPLVVLDSLKLGNAESDANGVAKMISNIANSVTVLIGVLGTLGIWWFVRKSTKPRRR